MNMSPIRCVRALRSQFVRCGTSAAYRKPKWAACWASRKVWFLDLRIPTMARNLCKRFLRSRRRSTCPFLLNFQNGMIGSAAFGAFLSQNSAVKVSTPTC